MEVVTTAEKKNGKPQCKTCRTKKKQKENEKKTDKIEDDYEPIQVFKPIRQTQRKEVFIFTRIERNSRKPEILTQLGTPLKKLAKVKTRTPNLKT